MNAIDMTRYGFDRWTTFATDVERDLLGDLPTVRGVYAVLLPAPVALRRGSSDIGYIGRAVYESGLRGRIRQYFHPGKSQRTNRAMKERLSDPAVALRIGFTVRATVEAGKRLESDLLLQFEAEHGQLPPFNRQRALARTARAGSIDVRPRQGEGG